MSDYAEHMAFEAEARRVAEAVWRLPPGGCQPEHYDGATGLRELDGLARLRDVTHLMMVTVSRKLEKAKEDVKKLGVAEKIETRRALATTKWLITKYQLDAEHVKFARDNGVAVLTLDQFKERFFDGRRYLQARRHGAFGSARNLANGSISIPENEYIELPMDLVQDRGNSVEATNVPELRLDDVIHRLIAGEIVVLIAPFGAGKSLTSREIFLELERGYLKGSHARVPVAINLREHWAQPYGDEILERHARSMGFEPREDLVVAWRVGVTTLLVDGFDEVAAQVVARADDARIMRDVRSEALRGVRNLVDQTPSSTGILLCGRDHYFDDFKDLTRALGLTGRTFSIVRLGEFTEQQARTFLERQHIEVPLPDWLPRKPLILGYLAHRGLLQSIVQIDSSHGFGYAWNEFLRLICEREAAHDQTVMDPDTLRRVLERLACNVRATTSGTGPITAPELAEAYQRETGVIPGEGVLMQLQRLPGLTPREQDPTARSFIDEDLLAALQGSALSRYALEASGGQHGRIWIQPLSFKGIAMASYLARTAGADASTLITRALASVQGDHRGTYEVQVGADCLLVALEMAREEGFLDCRGATVAGGHVGSVDLEDVGVANLTLEGCAIDEVTVGPRIAESNLQIRDCIVGRVRGAATADALPPMIFQQCTILEFDDVSTNTAVLRSGLEPAIKTLLTILRKLYLQAGGGRKIGALRRGLPTGPILDAVDDVIQILESEGIIHVTAEIAHPVRRQTSRIRQILASVALSTDPVVTRVKDLT